MVEVSLETLRRRYATKYKPGSLTSPGPDEVIESLDVEEPLLDEDPGAIDSEAQYLQNLCRWKPLPREEINDLFFWIEAGILAEERLYGSDLSEHLTLLLQQVVIEGQRAMDRVVESNLRLVLYVARRSPPRISLSDRFASGCEGLLRAVQKFDLRLGYSFSTYATNWIRQSIFREIANSGTVVRTPVHVEDKIRWNMERERFEFKGDTNFSLPDRIWILSLYEPLDVCEFDLDFDLLWSSVSRGDELGDLEADHMRHRLNGLLTMLPVTADVSSDDVEMVLKRYGFEGEPQTLDEIGKRFGLTRERIRQRINNVFPILAAAVKDEIASVADVL